MKCSVHSNTFQCKSEAVDDTTLCRKHKEMARLRSEKHRALHLDVIREKDSKAQSERRAGLKARGLCQTCGKVPSETRCDSCKKRASELGMRLTNERKHRLVAMLGGQCVDCGLVSEYDCLYQFHHTDPSQKNFNISKILTYKWETIVEEVKKCTLLCANCHFIREFKDAR